MNEQKGLSSRLERERKHARVILSSDERNWGWRTPAGQIRWERRLAFLASAVDSEARVLEIGAGTGTFTGDLSNTYKNLVAIDISEDLLFAASQKHPNVDFKCMDAHNLEFPDDSFDAIVGCSVLHHLDWARALEGFQRKLRNGGVIRFSEPNLANPQIFIQKNVPMLKKMAGDSPDEYAFTKSQIETVLGKAGFKQIEVRPYEFLHPAVPASLIPLVQVLEALLERTALRAIGGSLLISAHK